MGSLTARRGEGRERSFISPARHTCECKNKLSAAHVHFSAQRFLSRRCRLVYLVGFARELAAAELALDLPLGAVVLQVVGQVAARQLDGAAVGAGDDVEGAGGEVALGERRQGGEDSEH